MKTVEEFLSSNGFVTADQLDRQGIISSFLDEMAKGLKGEKSSLAMIPSYIGVNKQLPEGAKVAVLDAGGTNFRSAIVAIPATVESRMNRPMPGAGEEVDKETFYATFAEEVRRVLPLANMARMGWCFSYPCEITESLDAKLTRWTKGIKAPEIVGQYVGGELMKRIGGGEIAVVNDTVATLLAGKALERGRIFSSYLGFILGTGTNVAYVERTKEGAKIINAESGAFNKIARSSFDEAMDAKQGDCGANIFEKMISGAYLGNIALEMYRAAAKGGLFSARVLSGVMGLGELSTIDLDGFCASTTCSGGECSPLTTIFSDPDDAKMARRLGRMVYERAAVLTAIHLAAFAIRTGEGVEKDEPIAIAIDGSTYYKTKTIQFSDIVKQELDDMLVKRRNIHYEILPHIEDAPLIGAAIAALM